MCFETLKTYREAQKTMQTYNRFLENKVNIETILFLASYFQRHVLLLCKANK